MYPHQADRLTQALEREALDALIATTPENIAYVTGFRSLLQAGDRGMELHAVFTARGTALVVPAADAVTIAVESAEVDHVRCYGRLVLAEGGRPEALGDRGRAWIRFPAPSAADALAAALEALGVRGRVGLDEGGLSPAAWRRTVERLGASRVVDGSPAFAEARRVKGPWEIDCLRRGLHIVEEATNEVIQALKPGVTEREAAARLRDEVLRRGAEPHGLVLLFGERSAFPAVPASDRPLRGGDIVRFDAGCVFKGYHAQLGRTAVMGEPDQRQQRAHDALQHGLEAAIDAVRAGSPAGAIFERAVAAVREGGLPDYDRGHVGHGIGLEPYERPKLTRDADAPIEAGMILTVQTPYYAPGWGGLTLRDTVLVMTRGQQVLNRSLRGLLVLD